MEKKNTNIVIKRKYSQSFTFSTKGAESFYTLAGHFWHSIDCLRNFLGHPVQYDAGTHTYTDKPIYNIMF